MSNVTMQRSEEKLEAMYWLVEEAQAGGQPVLISTTSILQSERASSLLWDR